MLVDKFGYYSFNEKNLTSNYDRVVVEIAKLHHDIVYAYGTDAEVSFLVPIDGKYTGSLLVEFDTTDYIDGINHVFIHVTLTPQEIHMLKKRFDEILLF